MNLPIFVLSYKKAKSSVQGADLERQGVAMLIVVLALLTFGILLVVAGAFLVVSETKTAIAARASSEALSAAEAGAEEVIMRVRENLPIPGTIGVTVGNAQATVTTTVNGNQYTVVADGVRGSLGRTVQVQFEKSTTLSQFFYGIQVGDGGLEMENNASVNGNIFSNGNITGDNGSTITGDAIVAGGINTNPSVEWTNHNADQFFATTSSNRDIAQSFTATATGAVPKISVYLAKVGNPTGDIILRLHNDNSNKPATSSLASVTIPRTTVGTTPSWIDVAFSSQPNITSGTKYWIVLDYGTDSGTNHWNWRKDNTDVYANNTGKYTSNCCSGNPTWIDVGGDLAFRVWIGGTNTKIEDMTIGNATTGTGRANLFVNVTIHGSACPNQYCIVENPSRGELPISDGVIQDWKNDAAAGGQISGDYNVTTDVSLGPREITGNLNMTSNNKVLTLTGTVYVHGNIDISNGSSIHCDSSYQADSCIILSDGWIHLANNGQFFGSGQTNSYIMLLSTLACTGIVSPLCTGHHNGAIDLHNNADGAIFYAGNGFINLHNNVGARELVGYKINLDQNAVVTYESGLANVNFSSGPSGGYAILSWREIAL